MARFPAAGPRFAAVLGVHVLLIAAIAQMKPERTHAPEPVTVSFITPAESRPSVPLTPSRPAVQIRTSSPAPVTPDPAPAPATAPLPEAIRVPAPQHAPDPAPALSGPPAVAFAAPALPPAPLPVIAPRFDAAYLDNPSPVYPALSRRLGERGRVLLRVYVNADGTAREVQVRTPSGSARLDQAAKQAVERWRFVPARQGEDAVGAWVLVPISFQLEG